MPPKLATLLTLGLICYLFRRDFKEQSDVTPALWIPICWLIIACSREISEWCAIFGIPGMGGSLEEGTPINRLFYLTLIVLGLRILMRRGVSVEEVARHNVWLTVFMLWCLLAVTWSDEPFVSLKRWIKVVGQPIMALIILTELDPKKALVCVIKRCSYILLPVSILFIKYYPEFGRSYGEWSGVAAYSGITSSKNQLGVNCLIVGFVMAWHLLMTWRLPKSPERRSELRLCGLLIYMNGWLIWMADSKTPLVALCVGLALLIFTGLKWVNMNRMSLYLVAATALCVMLESFFGVYEVILKMLGRNASLTERTDLWPVLLKEEINPVLGVGFESFWLGARLDRLWGILEWQANEAHNGYLETYLNVGLVGLVILICMLLAVYAKSCRDLITDPDWGRLRLGFLIAMIIYNWTESGFRTTHPIFFMLYIVALDVPRWVQSTQHAHEDGAADPYSPRQFQTS